MQITESCSSNEGAQLESIRYLPAVFQNGGKAEVPADNEHYAELVACAHLDIVRPRLANFSAGSDIGHAADTAFNPINSMYLIRLFKQNRSLVSCFSSARFVLRVVVDAIRFVVLVNGLQECIAALHDCGHGHLRPYFRRCIAELR